VIKIERPGVGDDTRSWGPPFLKDGAGDTTTDAAYFFSANRGKKSMTIDIASPQGQEIIRALARDADVVVENYKVGTLARYGLAWNDLRALNPRLVYCSVTGFGQDGPRAHLPGYDYVFQGMGGFMSITGAPDGEPMKHGLAIGDLFAGMYATTAILAALEHRHVSGEGQYIDLSLLDCVVAITSYQAMNFFLSGNVPRRMGNAHPNMVPYQVFACSQGEMIVACGNDGQYAALCRVLGLDHLARDPRFATVSDRSQNRDALIPLLAHVLRTKTKDEWVSLMEAANVPCGPINDIQQVFEEEQVRHRGMKVTLPHSSGAELPTVASPIRLSATPIRYGQAGPRLGEHTATLLAERLGLTPERIAELRSQGVIGA
jgi:crotonobetainyl-CoA:carnitine CoA-transferase CaiB-like acyl-CoA transferase